MTAKERSEQILAGKCVRSIVEVCMRCGKHPCQKKELLCFNCSVKASNAQ